jgi:hypothetical protein
MLKFMTAGVIALVLVFASQAPSEAARPWRRVSVAPTYAAAPVATRAQGTAPSGYRSYSYEPAARTYRVNSMRRSYFDHPSFFNAGSKALGHFGE